MEALCLSETSEQTYYTNIIIQKAITWRQKYEKAWKIYTPNKQYKKKTNKQAQRTQMYRGYI
jgi:hypothetical protein